MTWKFLPRAAEEYLEITQYYADIELELGVSFVDHVEAGIERILANPKAWPEVDPGIRRHLIQRFPYGIFFRIDGDLILIVALMHTRRRPGRWRERQS